MVRESDNAVPDYLRGLLGSLALRQAAAATGWDIGRLPTLTGQTISLLVPRVGPDQRWIAAQRYAASARFRAEVRGRSVDPQRVRAWVDTTFSATPANWPASTGQP